MQSFKAASTNPEFYSLSSYFRRDDSDRNQTRFTDLGELEQSATAFPHDDAVVLSPTNTVGGVPDSLHYGTLNVGGCLDIGSTITGTGGRGCVDTGQQQPYMYQQQKGTTTSGNGQFENWGDNSAMADNGQQTDTYTDVDTDDKNHHGALMVVDSTEQAKERTTGDQKTLRRLAQNGEAARKSRLRKKDRISALKVSDSKIRELLTPVSEKTKNFTGYNVIGSFDKCRCLKIFNSASCEKKGVSKYCAFKFLHLFVSVSRISALKVQPDQEMTVEEFKAWIYRFDNDHNGQLSREELKEALRSLRVWFGWWRARQAMKSSDFNGSGQIDNPKEFEKLVNYAQQRLGMKIHENNDW